ncbi:MAG: hypothetical protein KJ666_03425 [Bacteroidetes bacterium]|nr:hypothetical protein [Bacteroidota bacterium]
MSVYIKIDERNFKSLQPARPIVSREAGGLVDKPACLSELNMAGRSQRLLKSFFALDVVGMDSI